MNTQNKLVVLTIIGALSIAACGKTDEGAQPDATAQPEATPETAPAAPLASATAPQNETTAGTDIDDSAITTKVKSALLADEVVEGLDISVETHKGEVQLSGFVDNEAQMDRAVEVARGVEDVKNVENKMSLKTAETTVGEKIDDGIITTKVKAALLDDESGINSTDITVETREGEVQLSGFVDDQTHIDRAVEVAQRVEDVKNVINKLSVRD